MVRTMIPLRKVTKDELRRICVFEGMTYDGFLRKVIELYHTGEMYL